MRFSAYAGAVASISSIASAGVLFPRQSAQSANLTKLGGWVETLTARPNGHLLLNRLDAPELWTIDPVAKTSSKLLTIPDAAGLSGIAEVSPDVYVVVSGGFNTTSFALNSGSYAVWKVDLTGSTPKSTLIKKIPESGFLIGAAAYNSDTVFIADAAQAALYTVTLSTGNYSIALQDAKMKAPSGALINEGIHGLKIHDGYIYFTNTFGNTFNKIKLDNSTGKVTGGVIDIPVTPALDGPEDFAFGADGSAYIATFTTNAVFKVSTVDGKSTRFANATQASSVVFGRTEKDRNTLYVATASGQIFSAGA